MGGRMKALLKLNGELFIERQLAEMSKVCNEILIIANEPSLFEQQLSWTGAEVRIIPDLQPGKGPLAGLQAAMSAARNAELWAVACDMPRISSAAADTLLAIRRSRGDEGRDAAVPLVNGRLQPLHAVYHRRCAGIIDGLLEAGRFRVMELLDLLDYAVAEDGEFINKGISPTFTENVNTPEDLEQLEQSQ
jgi:molybdopterin-guanine dinucleotide biosynthesis protein A